MLKINNPVIPGMSPDPSIIRVDDIYYLVTSTFHWLPAIQIFKSTDLANWQLIDYVFKQGEINLSGTHTPAGIWAPHLSYDGITKKYWLIYSHMINMAGREFNADTYVTCANNIQGPWSAPIYITSIGFDPALFHDEDGKHYLTILEWETRQGYQAPGHIVIAEIDLDHKKLVSPWVRLTQGFTTRGCAEAPQLYKKQDYYYLLIAAGGTGYAHGIEIGRSKTIFGPYQPHPSLEPIVTSSPNHLFSLGDPDAGHFEMYNPNSIMQKAGHGSLVETQNGDWYIAHLMSRPIKNTLLNPLGRETSIQKMQWTDDGWLVMADGSNLAKMDFDSELPLGKPLNHDVIDEFDGSYSLRFMTPYRNQTTNWVNSYERTSHLRIYGQNSLFSQVNPAIMATRTTSFNYHVQTKVEFQPEHYSQTAGVGLYYDANNWIYFHLTYSEQLKTTVLSLLQAKLGVRIEFTNHRVAIPHGVVELKIVYQQGIIELFYKRDNAWLSFMSNLDVLYLSDEGVNGEPGEIGGFTGLFNFIASVDSYQHQSYADFDYYYVINND
ncbi:MULTISPECIES: family 43 glycosylhydrolase [unclassified Gilliamella]|uniref:family 43 glycosylhydrolase n=1 Tax=unclassified Gilliamella TaxID=2685620 RepID=UPI00226A1244|nr:MULTISPECIES: family 43 glycosylhydrolase [unclassified Gilliamella]MCX8728600.1 family 43 glycosylhydrolase [Gilliamella sp. B2838]MCX8739971.1 family 43 glycosylhydrolase [Gilliamella sp. B2824]